MKKRTLRILALLLTLMVTLGMFSACGQKEEQQEESAGDITINLEDVRTEGSEYFPLAEKTEYSLWTIDNQFMTPGYESTDTAALVEAATNVHLDVTWVTAAEAGEKFGLMIASGDITDMVYGGAGLYIGGAQQAVVDGVFKETTELIEKWMPNYKALLEQDPQVARDVTADNGKRYAIYSLYVDDDMNLVKNLNSIGLAVRRDWLEQADLPMPETIDDWTKVLTAFKDMGVEAPLMIGSNGRLESGAFLSAYGILEDFYMEGDTVKYGPAQPAYKEYLRQMKNWYDAGLLDPNFTANDSYAMLATEDMGGDKTGAGSIWWQFGAREIANLGYQVEEDFFYEYAPYPVLNAGDTPQAGYTTSSISSALCINADLTGERLETLCRYIDYHYTRESMLYHNYGQEGVHYYVDENDQIFYSDMMTQNPENNVTGMRIRKLAQTLKAGAISLEANYASYPDGVGTECLDMQPTWEAGYDLVYPVHATMTNTELTEYNVRYTNIITLVDEMSAKFILGVESLENFDAYVEQLYQFGLQDCIDYKQAAYDRYMNR